MKLYLQILFFLGAAALGGRGLAALASQSRVHDAIRQTVSAKVEYARMNQGNEAVLNAYDEANAAGRLEVLADAGLLSLQAEAFVTDPGALNESPVGHVPTEQDRPESVMQHRFSTAMR